MEAITGVPAFSPTPCRGPLPLSSRWHRLFFSQEIHCESCLETHHRNGTVTYAHQLLGAAFIHPDKREVIPLMPEPIVKQDGSEKNDCERNAAKRFVTKFRRDHPHLKVIVTEDSLNRMLRILRRYTRMTCAIFWVSKRGIMLFCSRKWPRLNKRVASPIMTVRTATRGCTIAFALSVGCRSTSLIVTRVNFIECWETVKGKVQHFSWVTDLRVNKGTVYRIMQGARARWRIENETFNTLKNQGYHFEHNFGHGYEHLSVVFAELMMLAFLVDQVQQLCCPLFQEARAKWGSKRLLWEKTRALFFDYALA